MPPAPAQPEDLVQDLAPTAHEEIPVIFPQLDRRAVPDVTQPVCGPNALSSQLLTMPQQGQQSAKSGYFHRATAPAHAPLPPLTFTHTSHHVICKSCRYIARMAGFSSASHLHSQEPGTTQVSGLASEPGTGQVCSPRKSPLSAQYTLCD